MNETLLFQLKDDLQELFDDSDDFQDVVVKIAYEDDNISYPCVVIHELENTDDERYYDMQEHVVDVSYQFDILAESTDSEYAVEHVMYIMEYIKTYMRDERYSSLQRFGGTPITTHPNDTNIKIGYMRYEGCIDIDTNTIYRRK